jgi:hypothetical protein
MLIGDDNPNARRFFGEGQQKEIVDWIRANGRPVDPALWRSVPTEDPRPRRGGGERTTTELYDLRPNQPDG